MRSARRWAATGVLAIGTLLVAPGAGAEEVSHLPRQINDVNGQLAAGEQSLREALIALDEEDGIDLYVLSVDTTDGVPIDVYADEIATRSDLGRDEPLFVMATRDEDYYLSVTDDFPLDDNDVDRVTDSAETAFAAGDYAGAARNVSITMAELITPGVSSALVVGGIVGVIGVAVAGTTLVRSRRNRRPGHVDHGHPDDPSGTPPVPLDELRRDVSRRLVSTDEDVRGADRELAFAQAEFGDAAVTRFVSALDEAKQSMQAAFRLRQQLEDDIPEDEPTQRRMLAEIAERCDRAHETLAAQAGEFATLRDIANRAASIVPVLQQRTDALSDGVREAEATLEQLRTAFSPAAVAPVAHVPAEVTQRIAFARNSLSGKDSGNEPGTEAAGVPPHVQALEAVGVPPAGGSAVAIRSAEIAVGEAEELLAGLARLAGQTRAAARDLPAALAGLEADLASATEWPANPALQQAMSNAQAAAQRAHTAGPGDPLATLTALTQADNALDHAVASVRNEQAEAARAAERLKRTVVVARAALDQANDLIGAHGDRIGPTARTHAAEAAQLLGEAQADADPVQALARAERANELAQLAISAAQQDVAGAGGSGPTWGGGYGSTWGGGGYGPSWGGGGWGGGSVFGGGWSSGGSRSGSWGSGWSGSSSGGSRGGSRRSGGSSARRGAGASGRSRSSGGRRGSGRR